MARFSGWEIFIFYAIFSLLFLRIYLSSPSAPSPPPPPPPPLSLPLLSLPPWPGVVLMQLLQLSFFSPFCVVQMKLLQLYIRRAQASSASSAEASPTRTNSVSSQDGFLNWHTIDHNRPQSTTMDHDGLRSTTNTPPIPPSSPFHFLFFFFPCSIMRWYLTRHGATPC